MNFDISESFAQMVREKGIDKDVLGGIIEDIFECLLEKFGEDAKYDVVVNMDRGDIEIFLERTIVDQVQNPNTEISIRGE
jgi:N utilization substance protein A